MQSSPATSRGLGPHSSGQLSSSARPPSSPSSLSSPTSKPIKAVAFPEGSGYFLVKVLSTNNWGGPDQGDIQIVQSRDSGTLAVRKWYHSPGAFFYKNLPAEVRFSNLTTFPRFPFFNRLIAWQDHRQLYGDGACALIFEHINGGTVRQLINLHWQHSRRVPEAFIWHYIAQVGQAIGYLHLGYEEGKPLPPDWIPIAHMDIEAINVMLHYDVDKNPEAAALPQIKVIDFGYAARADDTEYRSRVNRMVAADALKKPRSYLDLGGYMQVVYYMLWHKLPGPPGKTMVEAYWPCEVYSRRLMEMVRYLADERGFQSFQTAATKKIVEYVVPTAKRKVDEFRRRGELYNVDWTKPEEPANVPLDVGVGTEEVRATLAGLKGPREAVVIQPPKLKVGGKAGKVFKLGGLRLTVLDSP